MVEETRLIEWNRIKAAIAQCEDIKIMSKWNYSLDAIQKWAKQSEESLATQNEIAEYRLRLNRKQGEWIEANISEKGYSNLPTQNDGQGYPTLAKAGIDYHDSPKFRALARLPEEKFERFIAETKERKEELTSLALYNLAKQRRAHVSYNTGHIEWYTPQIYIEAAREVMGSIDTDPASSHIANEIVKATTYYTAEDDGRLKPWPGNVWLNPPYAQPLISEFCELLVQKYKDGEIQQACALVNNATETGFFQEMLRVCEVVCFIKGRVKFVDKEGVESGAPLQGQAVLYFGEHYQKFAEVFYRFGAILYGDSQRKNS